MMAEFYARLIGDVWSRRNVVLIWGILSFGSALYGDFYLSERQSLLLVSVVSLATIVGQIDITKTCLAEQGLLEKRAQTSPSFFPRVFGLGLVSGLAIALGFLLLVVPGLLLLFRWSASIPAMIAKNGGISESLEHSWELTGQDIWLVAKAYLPYFALWAIAIASIFYSESTAGLIVFEFVVTLAILLHWFIQLRLFVHFTQAGLDAP